MMLRPGLPTTSPMIRMFISTFTLVRAAASVKWIRL
jgi:hypothetical protein